MALRSLASRCRSLGQREAAVLLDVRDEAAVVQDRHHHRRQRHERDDGAGGQVADLAGGQVDLELVAARRCRSVSHCSTGRPTLMALRKKMRAKLCASTAPTPASLMMRGACSRLEPRPKLRPPTTKSPGRISRGELGARVLEHVLGELGQVGAQVEQPARARCGRCEMSSPNSQARPRSELGGSCSTSTHSSSRDRHASSSRRRARAPACGSRSGIASTTSMPSITRPNTACLPSRCGVAA